MSEPARCVHAFVSGTVQGVWFRRFTQQQANALAVTGWAKNLSDGRVEIMLAGSAAAIEQMLVVLEQGPPMAQVSQLQTQQVALQSFTGFVIR